MQTCDDHDDDAILSVNRLRKEINECEVIKLQNNRDYTLGLIEDNIYNWIICYNGKVGTPYENGVFFVEMIFSENYPFSPPQILFRTLIYHCNIDVVNGMIRLNENTLICNNNNNNSNNSNNNNNNNKNTKFISSWIPTMKISSLLEGIDDLLQQCQPSIPLLHHIAHQYLHDRKSHDQLAKEWTKRFAI